MDHFVAGVDIGGTHITAGIVNTQTGELLVDSIYRASIDPTLDKEAVIHQWANGVRECFSKAALPVGKTGIAMPGPFDYENGISYITGLHKYENLYGHNVKALLGEELMISASDIRLINDASAYLYGEINHGAGKGYTNLAGITLGTGLGSASWYNNILHEGDLWNMPFESSRAEDYVCARWLITQYEKRSGEKVNGVKAIAERVGVDRVAAALFVELGYNLGQVLCLRYREQSPEAIIVGGNISKAWNYFIPAVIKVFQENQFPARLEPARLGENAALVGASCLWK